MILQRKLAVCNCAYAAALRAVRLHHPISGGPWHDLAMHQGGSSPRKLHASSINTGQVGFVGLGNMGSCMATRLVRAGHKILIFDADKAKTTALAASTGAKAAESLRDLAQRCNSIITMLPNTPHVEAVYLGSINRSPPLAPQGDKKGEDTMGKREAAPHGGGLLDWVGKGTLLVDSSTIDPLTSRKVNVAAATRETIMLDAPVSGGVPAAANGSLTFIVGGTEEGVERARPLLEAMGKQLLHCGDAGAGCVAKVCNNLALAVSMIGVSEAMSLGSKMGMDPKVLASVLNASTARCWSSAAYNPCPGVMEDVPSSRGFAGGFAAKLMEKDLHLALQAARESSQSTPMGALAHQLYTLMCAQGQGHASKDFSGIYELISGTTVTGPRRTDGGIAGG